MTARGCCCTTLAAWREVILKLGSDPIDDPAQFSPKEFDFLKTARRSAVSDGLQPGLIEDAHPLAAGVDQTVAPHAGHDPADGLRGGADHGRQILVWQGRLNEQPLPGV